MVKICREAPSWKTIYDSLSKNEMKSTIKVLLVHVLICFPSECKDASSEPARVNPLRGILEYSPAAGLFVDNVYAPGGMAMLWYTRK